MPILTIEAVRAFFQKKAAEPILTIAAIRENPWNVISDKLPENPCELLLNAAYIAATYCRDAEYMLMMAARDGAYVPEWWTGGEDDPDVHEESEERGWRAEVKLSEISGLRGEDIEEPTG